MVKIERRVETESLTIAANKSCTCGRHNYLVDLIFQSVWCSKMELKKKRHWFVAGFFIFQASFQLQVLPRIWLGAIKVIGTFHALSAVAIAAVPEKEKIRWWPILIIRRIRLRSDNIKTIISNIQLTKPPKKCLLPLACVLQLPAAPHHPPACSVLGWALTAPSHWGTW